MLFQVLSNQENGHRRIVLAATPYTFYECDWTVILRSYMNMEIFSDHPSLKPDATSQIFLNSSRNVD
ncbi:hypothetical protein C1929_09500 [Stenotrophomonas sp. ZAC14D1_NAIMI4_6]|nr:hypothetical protein C1929_09500 [Stenotrophomonas sp. ZAC14D1_NAIMI4_6]AWH41158.1 hypothetical protein C1927_09835 [Stenotrophomonas sp. ZAC14D1_NAIMI4_1]